MLLPDSFSNIGSWWYTQLSASSELRVNKWIESQLSSSLPRNQLPLDQPSPSTPPVSLYYNLKLHLQTGSITPLECITMFTWWWPQSASPTLLNYSLQVHLWVHLIMASKSISQLASSHPSRVSLSSLHHHFQVHLQSHSSTGYN